MFKPKHENTIAQWDEIWETYQEVCREHGKYAGMIKKTLIYEEVADRRHCSVSRVKAVIKYKLSSNEENN